MISTESTVLFFSQKNLEFFFYFVLQYVRFAVGTLLSSKFSSLIYFLFCTFRRIENFIIFCTALKMVRDIWPFFETPVCKCVSSCFGCRWFTSVTKCFYPITMSILLSNGIISVAAILFIGNGKL